MKISALITEFVGTRRFEALSDSTKRHYWAALQDLEARFGGLDASEVKRRDLLRAQDEMAKAPSMATRLGQVASLFFNYAIDMEYVQTNPAVRLTRNRSGSLPRWDTADIERVINMGHPIISTAVAIAFHTGQRQSDILTMRWEDIKDGNIVVTQQKTGQPMVIKMSEQLKEILGKLKERGPFILTGPTSMTGAAFRNMFKRATRKIGIDLPFHGIRKTVACILAERGVSTNEIAAILGHRTLEMAQLYTKQADKTKMITSAVNALASG